MKPSLTILALSLSFLLLGPSAHAEKGGAGSGGGGQISILACIEESNPSVIKDLSRLHELLERCNTPLEQRLCIVRRAYGTEVTMIVLKQLLEACGVESSVTY